MVKKLIILAVFICSSALYASSQISWNVKAGGHFDGKGDSGYQVGAGVDYFVNNRWGVQSLLMFISQEDTRFELPIQLAYKIPLTKNTKLIVSGGETFIFDEDFNFGLAAGSTLEFRGKYTVGLIGSWGITSTYNTELYGLNIGYKF